MKLAPIPTKQYIEQREEEYWIEGTRISLDSVVYSFLNGESPESIAQNFPILSLEQVYGAIAFYLAKPFEVEDLARGINWVLEDTERYNQLCIRARQKVEQHFTLELQASKYLKLYNEILESFK